MSRAVRYARLRSINRGLLGEDRFWRFVYSSMARRRAARRLITHRKVWGPIYSVVYGYRILRNLLDFGPEVVSVEKLKPGQFVRVEAIDPATLSPAERKLYKR
jgi:hypothetical protein